jgi:hypothetical protein
MPPKSTADKKEFKAGSKMVKNAPKGGKAKDAKRAADKVKQAEKKAAQMAR